MRTKRLVTMGIYPRLPGPAKRDGVLRAITRSPRRRRPRLWLIPLLACFGLPAWPQLVDPGDPQQEDEELRQYSVEVIVFEYSDEAATGEEVFVPEPPPEAPLPEEVVEFLELPDYRSEREAQRNYEDVLIEEIELYGPAQVFRTDPAQLTMQDTYARLVRLDAYQPLLHAGWTQNTVDREIAQPVHLRILGDPPLRLDGELTLYLSRYLHLIVDLALEDDDPVQQLAGETPESEVGEDIAYYGDARTRDRFSYAGGVESPPPVVRYKILEDRIFRNGEIRYFDHPKFGVIAKVVRYEAAEEVNPVETDEEFLAPANEPGDVGL